ncbi:MAG: hypothetical protein AABY22_18715 [Nanoarchaeota archaeon]
MKQKQKFQSGNKIIYLPESKIYDFGYFSQKKGRCIIYLEGCRNMQDSYSIDLKKIKKVND